MQAALRTRGIPHYLPLFSEQRLHGGRRRTVEAPLFPGYVFVCTDAGGRVQVLETNRVAQLLDVSDQDRLEHELAQIDRALAGGCTFDPYPYLAEGRAARVRSGPLMGLEGFIDAKARGGRLILCVQTLGRATSIEIDPALLEPLE